MKKLFTMTFICIVIAICAFSTFIHAQTDEIEKLMDRYREFEMMNGAILVSDGDKIIYKGAFGKANFEWNVSNDVDTKFEIASLSKQFTAIMVLQLIDKGLLSLDTKISDVLKEYSKASGGKITIGQLLSHTSGLIDTRHIKNFDNTLGMQRVSRIELISKFKEEVLLFEPGTKWSYSNFGYNLLAIILETVTGKAMNDLISEKIFKPSGMANSTTLEEKGLINHMAVGYEQDYYSLITRGLYHDPSWSIGSGNVVTTVEDWFKYYRTYNEGKLLSKQMMEQLTKPSTVVDADNGEKVEMRFCFMQDKLTSPKDTVAFPYASGSHYGAHTAAYHFYQDKKLIVMFINLKVQPMKMFQIGDNIAKILYGFPYDLPQDSYLRTFSKDIEEKGVKEAIVQYKKKKSEQKGNLSQTPRDFNRHGYYYLGIGKPDIAIEIFKLNHEIYPNNADLFDSLAEGYLHIGNKTEAIWNYKKSLELDPKNENAKKMIEDLQEN